MFRNPPIRSAPTVNVRSALHPAVLLLLPVLALAPPLAAQEERYVSDEVFIVLHAGPGANYRWLGKLTPGAQLTIGSVTEDGEWTEVLTSRGTEGWVQSEYLSSEPPAQVRLPAVSRQLEDAERSSAELRAALTRLRDEKSALERDQGEARAHLQSVTEELAQLRQISGSAIETADQNRRLETEVASMRTTIDTLEADNQRLQERVQSSAYLDGALAVLLGVIIALVVPRLRPKRRSSSSWA
jgi:SH3 domain protein